VSLRQRIAEEIRRAGPLPFSRYMEMCLYEPATGFYQRAQEQFGKAGDFYTASDVHAVFGRLLARQFDEMWRALGAPPRLGLVELGPGRGLLARDLLDWAAKKFPEFFLTVHVVLVERSAPLRQRLQGRLREHVSAGKARVQKDLPRAAESPAIIFASEFFDALPVEVITPRGEVRVAVEGDRLVEHFAPPSQQVLCYLDRYSVHPGEGERVEAGLEAQRWLRRAARALSRGFLVIIDYGYERGELLAGRHRGTVTARRRHTLSDSPYEAPGEQDITAHVNFTALEAAGREEGLATLGFITQSQFLMGIGEDNQFADAFLETVTPQERAKVALQLKHLVTPAGMGESFRVLVMAKGVAEARLSGLKFAR